MQDIKTKVDNLLVKIIFCDLRTEIGIDAAKKAIRLAIKEQDRDTRHACAEAVENCEGEMDADVKLICNGDAHSACMNARAL